jgi:hypothetical protein
MQMLCPGCLPTQVMIFIVNALIFFYVGAACVNFTIRCVPWRGFLCSLGPGGTGSARQRSPNKAGMPMMGPCISSLSAPWLLLCLILCLIVMVRRSLAPE